PPGQAKQRQVSFVESAHGGHETNSFAVLFELACRLADSVNAAYYFHRPKKYLSPRLYGAVNIKILKQPLHTIQECPPVCAVNDAMIVTHREIHHMTDSNDIPFFGLADNRSLFYRARPDNSYLGLVDNRRAHQAADAPIVCQCNGSTHQIVRI